MIFAEKLLDSDIGSQRPFSDYPGPSRDFEAGVPYFLQKFGEHTLSEALTSVHVTFEGDFRSNCFEFIMDSIRIELQDDNLRKCGFLMEEKVTSKEEFKLAMSSTLISCAKKISSGPYQTKNYRQYWPNCELI